MDWRDYTQNALAMAVFALALAIGYFAFELSRLSRNIPQILAAVESASDEVGPLAQEIAQISEMVPPIVDEVTAIRGQIPAILDEVAAVRETIPPVLAEVAETRKVIMPIIEEVELIRADLPEILETVDNTSVAVRASADQIQAINAIAPSFLDEMRATRAMIPDTLDRVDALLDEAATVGRRTSEGAVTGIVTGVVRTPFAILGGLTGGGDSDELGMEEFTDEDRVIALAAAEGIDAQPKGTQVSWRNPQSGTSGVFTLRNKYTRGGLPCVQIRNEAWRDGERITRTSFDACQQSNGEWQLR